MQKTTATTATPKKNKNESRTNFLTSFSLLKSKYKYKIIKINNF